MRKGWLFAILVLTALLAGCAGTPRLYEVKSVYMCAAEECGPAGQRVSADQMLRGLHKLLAINDGAEWKICEANPQTRDCESNGFGYLVFAGVVPGRGSTSSAVLKDIKLEPAAQVVSYNMISSLFWDGTPLACVHHSGKLAVRSVDEISFTDDPYYCNWMAIGNMTASFNFAVDTVDFDKGRIGGYWAHAVAGTGNGSGHGYAFFELPKGMPRGENWLTP